MKRFFIMVMIGCVVLAVIFISMNKPNQERKVDTVTSSSLSHDEIRAEDKSYGGKEKMNEVVEYLKKTGVMFLSSFDGEKPHVRPVGFVMEYDGKAYLTTGESGPIFDELHVNPYVEIAAMDPEMAMHRIRFSGSADFNVPSQAFDKYFELNPAMKGSKGISLFSVNDWQAVIYEGNQGKRVLTGSK